MIAHGQSKGKVSLKDRLTLGKFKAFASDTLDEYSDKIKHMNFVDLCEHAIKFGIRPNVERKRMEKSLLGEFRKAKAQYSLATGEIKQEAPINEEKQKKVLDLLAFIK